MKINITEFGKDRTIHSFDTHKGCESVNVFIETDDENENALFSFEEKNGKIITYDSDGNIIHDVEYSSPTFNQIAMHFMNHDAFEGNILVNGIQMVIVINRVYLDQDILNHIIKGCGNKQYFLYHDKEDNKFKLNITIKL